MKRDHLGWRCAPFFFVWKKNCFIWLLSFGRTILFLLFICALSCYSSPQSLHLDKPIGMYTNEWDSSSDETHWKCTEMNNKNNKQFLFTERNKSETKTIWWDVIICSEETANQYNSSWWRMEKKNAKRTREEWNEEKRKQIGKGHKTYEEINIIKKNSRCTDGESHTDFLSL